LIDRLTISLALDQSEDSTSEFRMLALDMKEEIGFPLYQGKLEEAMRVNDDRCESVKEWDTPYTRDILLFDLRPALSSPSDG